MLINSLELEHPSPSAARRPRGVFLQDRRWIRRWIRVAPRKTRLGTSGKPDLRAGRRRRCFGSGISYRSLVAVRCPLETHGCSRGRGGGRRCPRSAGRGSRGDTRRPCIEIGACLGVIGSSRCSTDPRRPRPQRSSRKKRIGRSWSKPCWRSPAAAVGRSSRASTPRGRFELPTCGLEVRCSIQLSYRGK